MKTSEVTNELVGKRCKSIFTAMMVTGTIEEVTIGKHTAEVKVRFDEPHRWGNETYEYDWSHGRLHDEFGSLQNYTQFVAGAFRGTIYYQYDYRHTDGELYSTVAQTLEECRTRRDEWMKNKKNDNLNQNDNEND